MSALRPVASSCHQRKKKRPNFWLRSEWRRWVSNCGIQHFRIYVSILEPEPRLDGSYLLFVEPRLIGNLDVVSVRVADVCREVVGAPFGPKARFLV
jgi:hypothetical protein